MELMAQRPWSKDGEGQMRQEHNVQYSLQIN